MLSTHTHTPSRIDVGNRVAFQLGREIIEGVVSEYRGPIGVGGRKIYRITVDDALESHEEAREVELPEDELTVMP